MREIKITSNDAGQRLDKYLFKYFANANNSFVYKMLRKKNIVLNDKKSDGKNLISDGDVIKIYMADETLNKFTKQNIEVLNENNNAIFHSKIDIIYEDDNILLINKPVGLLSQKSVPSDISANELCISYLVSKGEVTEDSLRTFRPSICNRLDRNTCGILIFAKTYVAANLIAHMLKERSVHKYYKCITSGKVSGSITLRGTLNKDSSINKVKVSGSDNAEGDKIITDINVIATNNKMSLLEVELITGKTHQIRAHLASINHPIIGDYKYGTRNINDYYKSKFGIKSQLLCSYKLIFPDNMDKLSYLSGKVFEIDIPDAFKKVLKDGDLEIKRS